MMKKHPPRRTLGKRLVLQLILVSIICIRSLYFSDQDFKWIKSLPAEFQPEVTVNFPGASNSAVVASSCPCISEYLTRLKSLGIENRNITFAEWEAALCRPPPDRVSSRPLILGVGPGTTATRSFALAVSLLQRKVLHYTVVRDRNGQTSWKTRGKENQKYYKIRRLINGMEERESWEKTKHLDYAALFQSVDAVFDYPFVMYALDILRAYPNARVIMTHRDPSTWYHKRKMFCTGWQKPKMCSVPFVMRPLDLIMTRGDLTQVQAVESFVATTEVIQCIVGPKRFLMVDAWAPPIEGWMPTIARFMNVSVPPVESNCTVPRHAGHGLECGEDASCKHCAQFTRKNSHLFPLPSYS